MDKKLQSDLYGFFCKDPEVWDKVLVEDTEKGYREKGEIGSCCSAHALEQFVTAIGGDDTSIEAEVKAIKSGQIEIKNDKDGNVAASIGKKSFSDIKIKENYDSFLQTVLKEKPKGIKGDFILSAYLTSTMGISYKLKLTK